MRASEGLEAVLPTLRRAFATANRLTDLRVAELPPGWSLEETGFGSLLVTCDADLDGVGFLVSDGEGALALHAVIDEELVLLATRRTGGLHVRAAA